MNPLNPWKGGGPTVEQAKQLNPQTLIVNPEPLNPEILTNYKL